MAKDVVKMITLHEAGHIFYHHSDTGNRFRQTIQKAIFVASLLLFGVFLPSINIFASLLIPFIGYLSYRVLTTGHVRYREFQADRFAQSHMEHADRAYEYGAEAFKKAIKDLKSSSSLTFVEKMMLYCMMPGGESIFARFDHGSDATRIERLRPPHQFSLLKAI